MVFLARKNGVRFQWVGFDGFYGDNPAFLGQLADNGEEFAGDIHKDHQVYYEDPKPIVPPPTSERGKQPSKLQAQARSCELIHLTGSKPPGAWKRVAIRDGFKGKIFIDILHRIIWLWDGKEPEARRWHLVVRCQSALNIDPVSASNFDPSKLI